MFFSKKKKFVGKTVDELGTEMSQSLLEEINVFKKRIDSYVKISTGGDEVLSNRIRTDIVVKVLENLLD